MNIRPFFTVLACLAVPLWAAGASAQTASPPQAAPAAAPTVDAVPGYRSAFEGYRPYTDEKIVSWKEANDTAARIGGWRAYAKEASQPDAPAANATPGPSAAPVKP